MPRNPQDARRRLIQAAADLFARNGFDQTTAAQIAAQAGVTERTFFRHFPDKREVLFDGQQVLGTALSDAIAAAPAELSPLHTLRLALGAITGLLEANRPFAEPRQRIIAATPSLQEREAAKHAALVRTVAAALAQRGVENPRAELAAHAGLAAFSYAFTAWFADPSLRLEDCLDRAFAELGGLTAPIMRTD